MSLFKTHTLSYIRLSNIFAVELGALEMPRTGHGWGTPS